MTKTATPCIILIIALISLILISSKEYSIIINEIAGYTEEASTIRGDLMFQYIDSHSFSKDNEVITSTYPRLSRFIEASWYGGSDSECIGCRADRIMFNGEPYDEDAYTAAANWLPINSFAVLRYGSHTVIVRITDRMVSNTRIDLSKAAFLALEEDLNSGIITIEYLPQ